MIYLRREGAKASLRKKTSMWFGEFDTVLELLSGMEGREAQSLALRVDIIGSLGQFTVSGNRIEVEPTR